MAYQNQNNKSQANESVNSKGFQFFNKNGIEGSTLILGLWNQQISLRIHPAKDPDKQTDTSVFDYDRSINLVIPPFMAAAIAKKCNEKFIPALDKGEEYTIGFAIGNSSVLVVSTGVKKTGKVMPYIAILRNIQPKTLIPNDMMSYTFNANLLLPTYDGAETATTFVNDFAEAIYFIQALKHLAVAVLAGENHGRRFVEKRFNDQVFKLYKDISDKIGGSFYASNGSARSYNDVPSVWGTPSQQTMSNNIPNTQSVEPTNVGSMDDLDSLL